MNIKPEFSNQIRITSKELKHEYELNITEGKITIRNEEGTKYVIDEVEEYE